MDSRICMKKAYRIGYKRYFSDDAFKEHIRFIGRYRDIIDEVALFTDFSHHGYWELGKQKELGEILRRRIEAYREIGIGSVGLNVLCTIGHLDEAWDVLPKPPMQTMVGMDKKQSRSCLCPTTDEYRRYISKRYKILAASGPDFIWLDDDIRIYSHGVDYPCFCPSCIAKFNLKHGFTFTFETLVNELKQNNQEIWKSWRQFQDNTYVEVISLIKNSIYSVNENIKIGYMSIGGNDIPRWIEASDAVKGRPGGGFYSDSTPLDAIRKALSCGTQILNYPEKVTDIQYEFEDFPYQTLSKSMAISDLECAAAVMNGCNGIAFNAMAYYDYPKLMEMIGKKHRLWETASRQNAGYENRGIYCYDPEMRIKFAEIGIPIAFKPEYSSALVLTGENCANMNDGAITEILSKNVLIDGKALKILTGRGFGGLCGVNIEKSFDNGVTEHFTGDALNAPFSGYIRDCFVSFNKNIRADNYVLSVTDKRCRILANLETITYENLGPCMTAYENRLGGKVAVSTYFWPDFMKFDGKRAQIQNVFDWLSGGEMPVRITGDDKLVPFIRRSQTSDDMLILLVNASFDEARDPTIDVRCRADKDFYIINDAGGKEKLKTVRNGDSTGVKTGSILPWGYAVITDA